MVLNQLRIYQLPHFVRKYACVYAARFHQAIAVSITCLCRNGEFASLRTIVLLTEQGDIADTQT